MTTQQALAFAVLAVTMGLFVWGRLRYDLVALLGLLAGIVVGVVPPDKAFTGFSDDVVIIVAGALLVSAAVERSGAIDMAMRPFAARLGSAQSQVIVLVTVVTAMSAFVKNIGALAMMIPMAFQLARRTGTSPGCLLMPMSFGALIGGLITLVGTSPNIIVSRVRTELVGQPFGMFDFAPVGLGIAIAGVAFLAVGYRLLPGGRKGAASPDAAFNIADYVTEAKVTSDTPVAGQTVKDLKKIAESKVQITAVVRDKFKRLPATDDTVLQPGDSVVLEGEPDSLEQAVARTKLQLARVDEMPAEKDPHDEIGVVEAIVGEQSPLVDRTVRRLRLYERFEANLLAISRRGERITTEMRSVKFRPGDVIVLQGNLKTLPETLAQLRCLPLAGRSIKLGRRRSLLPVAVLAIAMVLVATKVAPVAVAFFGAAVLLVLLRALSLREAYEVIDWPILIMLGALIPVSEAIQTTGATEIIAAWLSVAANALPPLGALTLVMVAAMAVTPFLNNAATVLVVAPIGATLATKLGYSPDPFLMAVATGAACDFLTPIGHQCNTLVMGPGGYRFGDYWRLGLPLSTIVVLVGVPLIAWFWPLMSR